MTFQNPPQSIGFLEPYDLRISSYQFPTSWGFDPKIFDFEILKKFDDNFYYKVIFDDNFYNNSRFLIYKDKKYSKHFIIHFLKEHKYNYASKKQVLTVVEEILTLSEKGIRPSYKAIIRSLGYARCQILFRHYYYSDYVIGWGLIKAVNTGSVLNWSKNKIKKWKQAFRKVALKIQREILFFAKIKYDQYCIDNYWRMEGLSKTPVRSEPRSLAYLAFHSLPESQHKLVSNLEFPVLDRCIDRLLHRHPYM